MSKIGKIVAFESSEEYGLIAPFDGGEMVLVRAGDFLDQQEDVKVGTIVRFSSLQGARGVIAYNLSILAENNSQPESRSLKQTHRRSAACCHGETTHSRCELGRRGYQNEIVNALVTQIPSITAAQVAAVGRILTNDAIRHGWLH
jgi:CspA family cold shock protein